METDLDVSRVVSRGRMWRVGGGGGRVGGGVERATVKLKDKKRNRRLGAG